MAGQKHTAVYGGPAVIVSLCVVRTHTRTYVCVCACVFVVFAFPFLTSPRSQVDTVSSFPVSFGK